MKRALLIFLAVIVASASLGFRITHTKEGLASAMGSAKSSLSIYKKNSQTEPGQKVIINVKGIGPQLGIVKSVKSGNIDVDTGATFVRVKVTDLQGKLVAVIPFLGYPFTWVGL